MSEVLNYTPKSFNQGQRNEDELQQELKLAAKLPQWQTKMNVTLQWWSWFFSSKGHCHTFNFVMGGF